MSITSENVIVIRQVASIICGLGMLTSLTIAARIRILYGENKKPLGAYLLLGFWALIPPIWFFLEWVFLRQYVDCPDDLKYTQELARNIWIALVVVLAAILGIKWPTE